MHWSVAVEAEGWPLISHFVTLGVGLAVVNGCVPAPAGVLSRSITDLPEVTYHVVHQRSALGDPRVAGLLDRIRGSVPISGSGGRRPPATAPG